jgi:glycine cleavage system H lipoate-binding protein
MKSKSEKDQKIIGFNITESECLWARAGIISFKQCNNAFDCNNCRFDKAMSAAVNAEKGKKKAPVPSLSDSLKREEYSKRMCRHVLTGRVDARQCGNDFRCDICEFDQMLDDVDAVYPTGKVPIVEVHGYSYADTYYYHDGHAWARVEYGGRVRMGLDDFALKLLGSPDGLDLPGPGKQLVQGDRAFTLKKGGNRAEVLAPVDGVIVAVNRKIIAAPRLAHQDPFRDGWLFLLEPTRLKRNLEGLYYGHDGMNWLTLETHRLHDMVFGEYGKMAATGAPPVDDVFSQVPEIGWEKLVRTFLKT